MNNQYLLKLRNGEKLSTSQQVKMILLLSLPAILSQVSSTVMQYIDASMVGSLGADASASIGLVSSTTWMFGGVAFAAITGFTVQVAHAIGAKDLLHARNIMKQGFIVGEIFVFILMIIGVSISFQLPIWLKGTESIQYSASMYFLFLRCFFLFNN